MDGKYLTWIAAVATVLLLLPSGVVAGGAGKAVARGAARALSKKILGRSASRVVPKAGSARAHRAIQEILRQDRLRDAKTKAVRLKKPRTVFRFTSLERAKAYRRHGIPPGTHFTATAGPGRPPSPTLAKKRYGLPRKPHARVTVRLPARTPVKLNKVIGGQPGYGEVKTHYKHLPPSSVKRITPLK